MGLLTGPKQEDIESFLKAKHIDALETYVVARRHNSALMGIVKLLASNLYYAMDAAMIRIIAATESELVVANPNWQIVAKLEDLDDKRIQRIPWAQLESVDVSDGSRVGKISWRYQGKTNTWVVDLRNPGVWHFNPTHFENLQKVITQRSEQ